MDQARSDGGAAVATMAAGKVGEITWLSGPVVRARVDSGVYMLEQVEVSDFRLVGEIIGLEGDIATIQVYEETSGIRPGDAVYAVGMPLSVGIGGPA